MCFSDVKSDNVLASGGVVRSKKLSAGASASSTPGVMMRSARSIKLKNRDPSAAGVYPSSLEL